jgi:hypothetical protein
LRSAQGLAVRAALLCALLASLGCFRPKILPGGFRCGDGGNPCPDNFTCDKSSGSCIPNGSDAGAPTGGTGGKGGQGGRGGAAGRDAGVDMPVDRPCTAQVANCRPADGGTTGMCDPVCNTGCGECHEKCSVNSKGTATCADPFEPTKPAGLLQSCDQYVPSDPAGQSDNCAPGEICINASTCTLPRCYQFCRSNSDCQGGASCSRDAGAYRFCDVPPSVPGCNPLAGARDTSGCSNGLFCYLSSSGQNTLCDCQFDRAGLTGNGSPGSECNNSRDCLVGNVCVLTNVMNPKQCFGVCLLPVDGGPADTCASNCAPLPGAGNSIYGWCNI